MPEPIALGSGGGGGAGIYPRSQFFFYSIFFFAVFSCSSSVWREAFFFLENTSGICGKAETRPEPIALGSDGGGGAGIYPCSQFFF